MTLLQQLQAYAQSDALPMHMPGHKRNTALAPYLDTLSAGIDLTEIPGFSNLHDPEGALAERMQDAAALWGSRRAWWLVGGSTAGLLAAIDAATCPGDKVLLARNCHKSVYNACMLCRLEPTYLQPHRFHGRSFAASITPKQIDEALTAHPDTRLVVLTSPTYEGLVSDITAISEVVHRHGALLLVDEAHGAHLGLGGGFPDSAVTQGADMVVQSLHKTLPCLTQTAMLHLCSHRVSPEELSFRLSVYQTSSPSYLLMASIDGCVTLLQERGQELLTQWMEHIQAFHAALSLEHLTLPLAGHPMADPSKLLISTVGTDITGPKLADRLRLEYGIETEMSTADTVLAMTGMGDTAESLLQLAAALNAIDRSLCPENTAAAMPVPLPTAAIPIYEAAKAEAELVPYEQSVDRIAADFLWAYPPGVPLVVPGEAVDSSLIGYLRHCKGAGVELHSPKGAPDGHIRVLKKG